MIECDIAVVGAGPVGLMAANLLGPAGHRVLVLEQDPSLGDEPRAVSIDDEAMRTLQAAGLAAEASRLVVPGTGTRYVSRRGSTLAYVRPPGRPRGFPPKNPVHQPDLARFLLDGARRFAGVGVRFGHRVTHVRPSDDAVELHVESPDGPAAIAARYVIACDGGRSAVRHDLGIRLAGSSFEQRWLVVDTLGDHHDQRFAIHHGDPRRPHVIVPGRDGRCRYEFLVLPHERDEAVVGLGFVRRLLRPYRSITEDEVARRAVYTFHALVAERWRAGRVFLAGDAAHMMPPFAGQGLNTGLRDVQNLTWKLDLVVRGCAGGSLLDTYERERRPHAQAMVDLSTRIGGVVMTTRRTRAAVRDALAWCANRVGPARRFLQDMRFKPAPSFDAGLVLRNAALGRDDPAGRMVDQPTVLTPGGDRALLDDVLGLGFALLAADVGGTCPLDDLADERWRPLQPRPVRVVVGDRMPRSGACTSIADLDGSLERALARTPGTVWLVRPDRYVVGAFRPAGETGFVHGLRAAGLLAGTAADPEPCAAAEGA